MQLESGFEPEVQDLKRGVSEYNNTIYKADNWQLEYGRIKCYTSSTQKYPIKHEKFDSHSYSVHMFSMNGFITRF
jgi:nitrous oxidase accessory protein NosD